MTDMHHVSYREPLAVASGTPVERHAWFNEWQFHQALDRAMIALRNRTTEEGYDIYGPVSWRVVWDSEVEPYLEFRAPVARFDRIGGPND